MTEYVEFQRRRVSPWAAAESAHVVEEPGIFGWAATDSSVPGGRLFVHGDVPARRLAALLDDLAPHDVTLIDEQDGDSAVSASCATVLHSRAEFGPAPTHLTGMLRSLAEDIAVPPLPIDMQARPIRRVMTDEPDGVPLIRAAAAAMQADPGLAEDPDRLAAHLRRAPDAVLLAALDRDGRVRATAGASLCGCDATIYFVTTDPAQRGRGLATAMTARALEAAARRGATVACLDASTAGRGIYARLGFHEVVALQCWDRRR
jgi:GNAT superfamily N-acetyltransferase